MENAKFYYKLQSKKEKKKMLSIDFDSLCVLYVISKNFFFFNTLRSTIVENEEKVLRANTIG